MVSKEKPFEPNGQLREVEGGVSTRRFGAVKLSPGPFLRRSAVSALRTSRPSDSGLGFLSRKLGVPFSPLTHHLGDFDHGKILRPGTGVILTVSGGLSLESTSEHAYVCPLNPL